MSTQCRVECGEVLPHAAVQLRLLEALHQPPNCGPGVLPLLPLSQVHKLREAGGGCSPSSWPWLLCAPYPPHAHALPHADETLEGANAYACDGCNQRTTARMSVRCEAAPNCLVVTAKRYGLGRFGKVNRRWGLRWWGPAWWL